MQTNAPQIRFAREFERNIRQLSKKYRCIQDDFTPLIEQLQAGETPGDQLTGTGTTAFKVRLRNSDIGKGKSAGYRVIYEVQAFSKKPVLFY
jgi:mRNA-degrading endonuclease RelE of RelBE toxin-antitoxin system